MLWVSRFIKDICQKILKSYHGLLHELKKFNKQKAMYFSIHPDISVFILKEQMENLDAEGISKTGYVHEFTVLRDMPILFYSNIGSDIAINRYHMQVPCVGETGIPGLDT